MGAVQGRVRARRVESPFPSHTSTDGLRCRAGKREERGVIDSDDGGSRPYQTRGGDPIQNNYSLRDADRTGPGIRLGRKAAAGDRRLCDTDTDDRTREKGTVVVPSGSEGARHGEEEVGRIPRGSKDIEETQTSARYYRLEATARGNKILRVF
ncbi:hypothetical protein SCAR479_01832 [Seiridium cardinale]|uniref:Uncharacterized protein n=1 Tax=Seiridium cardinale TaxID=138064 RepID=A0ABR2Y408_9PEZI